MGMNTSVVGLKPVDAKWESMYKIYSACNNAGISPPDEVLNFFQDLRFDCIERKGIEVEIEGTSCVEEYSANSSDGYIVDITKLPRGVTKILFKNSY